MSNMVVATNVLAMNSHRNLKMVGSTQSNASARLSSGYRINSAADDAAGLAISEKMRAQIRGLDMASKNAQDGVSLIQTAEGGMQEIDNMIQRIRELVVQVSNDTNESNADGSGDRQKVQDEINALTQEIDSMAERVEFNKKKVINGSYTDVKGALDAAKAELKSATASIAPATATMEASAVAALYGSIATLKASIALRTGSIATKSASAEIKNASVAAKLASGSIKSASAVALKVSMATLAGSAAILEASLLTLSTSKLQKDEIVKELLRKQSVSGLDATEIGKLSIAAASFSALASAISVKGTSLSTKSGSVSAKKTSALGLDASAAVINGSAYAIKGSAANIQASVELMQKNATSLSNLLGSKEALINSDATKAAMMKIDAIQTRVNGLNNISNDATDLYFQIGANAEQGIKVNIGSVKSDVLGIGLGDGTSKINVLQTSGTDITDYLASVDYALDYVTSERSKLGATQNRLEYTQKSLDISSENLTAAESRVRDADMAKEMMRYTQANVLQQAATSMLAQANQAPQNVLQLLR